jgi:hypothetical protein
MLWCARWVLPFSREMTLGALAQAPLLPWRWKMDITHWWLKRYFYGPAGIVHMMPGGGNKAAPRDNDYAGAPSHSPPQLEAQCTCPELIISALTLSLS